MSEPGPLTTATVVELVEELESRCRASLICLDLKVYKDRDNLEKDTRTYPMGNLYDRAWLVACAQADLLEALREARTLAEEDEEDPEKIP